MALISLWGTFLAVCDIWEALGKQLWGGFGAVLGPFRSCPGPSRSGTILGHPGAVAGSSWGALGLLGPS